jgi:hypothetical protein
LMSPALVAAETLVRRVVRLSFDPLKMPSL